MIRNIFLYLDRTYILKNPPLQPLWDLGLALFRDALMRNVEISHNAVDNLLVLIDRYRDKDQVSTKLIYDSVGMFVSLNVYLTVFEAPFLARAKEYYTLRAQKHVGEIVNSGDRGRVDNYLRYISTCLVQEETNASSGGYLDPCTKKSLLGIVETSLLTNCSTEILSGVHAFLKNGNISELKLLFELYKRVKLLPALQSKFSEYVTVLFINVENWI